MSLYSKTSILDDIVAKKRQELAHSRSKIPLQKVISYAEKADKPRGFELALRKKPIGIIAEIKKASPSKGVICHNFRPALFAEQYEQAGAACLSVLTDIPFFQGAKKYLLEARKACNIPVLRKDFMLDPYQIIESRAINADCVLLIVACLSDMQLQELHQTAVDYDMDVLIEVHNQSEVERALRLPSGIIGINNRDLKTFNVSLNTTLSLKSHIPASRVIVTESGISNVNDVDLMMANQVRNFLIGEQFMKTNNPGDALAKLLNEFRSAKFKQR